MSRRLARQALVRAQEPERTCSARTGGVLGSRLCFRLLSSETRRASVLGTTRCGRELEPTFNKALSRSRAGRRGFG